MLSICPRSCRCQGRSLSESKGCANSTEKETETEKSFAQDHTVLKRQPQNSNAGPKSPSPCWCFFPVAPHCLPQEPVVCGSFIRVQGVLKDKSCSAVGFNSQLKLSVFPWLTSPSVCHHFLPPPPQLLGSAPLPSLSLGTARSLIIYGITWKRMSRGPCPHLVLPRSSSLRKGSRLSSWGGGGWGGRPRRENCSNPGSTQASLPCGP